jgi:5-methylcytosine-specific restriction endonuclease McrA
MLEPVTTHCGKCGKLLTAARMDKEDRKSNKEVIRIYCHKCGKQFSSDLKPELDLYLHRDCGGRMYLVRPRDEYLCQICRKRVKK